MTSAHNIYHESLAETVRKQQVKRIDKAFGKKIGSALIGATLAQFWCAQLVVWGLGLYRIHSGIWSVWLIMEGTSSMLVACVALGMMRAVRDIQKAGTET